MSPSNDEQTELLRQIWAQMVAMDKNVSSRIDLTNVGLERLTVRVDVLTGRVDVLAGRVGMLAGRVDVRPGGSACSRSASTR